MKNSPGQKKKEIEEKAFRWYWKWCWAPLRVGSTLTVFSYVVEATQLPINLGWLWRNEVANCEEIIQQHARSLMTLKYSRWNMVFKQFHDCFRFAKGTNMWAQRVRGSTVPSSVGRCDDTGTGSALSQDWRLQAPCPAGLHHAPSTAPGSHTLV